jgi:hypothetical protein
MSLVQTQTTIIAVYLQDSCNLPRTSDCYVMLVVVGMVRNKVVLCDGTIHVCNMYRTPKAAKPDGVFQTGRATVCLQPYWRVANLTVKIGQTLQRINLKESYRWSYDACLMRLITILIRFMTYKGRLARELSLIT